MTNRKIALFVFVAASVGFGAGFLLASKTTIEADDSPQLPVPHSTEALDAVIEQARNADNPQLRSRALEFLSSWKPRNCETLLLERLKVEKDPSVLVALLSLVENRPLESYVHAISEHLKSDNSGVRRKAISAIGTHGKYLDRENTDRIADQIVKHAHDALISAKKDAKSPAFGTVLPALKALQKLKSKRAVGGMMAILKDGDTANLRLAATNSIKGRATKENEEALKRSWAMEKDWRVGLAIEQVLGAPPFNLTVDRKSKSFAPKSTD